MEKEGEKEGDRPEDSQKEWPDEVDQRADNLVRDYRTWDRA